MLWGAVLCCAMGCHEVLCCVKLFCAFLFRMAESLPKGQLREARNCLNESHTCLAFFIITAPRTINKDVEIPYSRIVRAVCSVIPRCVWLQ